MANYTSPVHIRDDQTSLTQINLETFPLKLTSNDYPFWLLWSPTPNNHKDPRKPCTKLLKIPTNPQWQKPTETLSFDLILPIYQKRAQHRLDSIDKLKINPRQKIPNPIGFGFKYTEDHPFICLDIDAITTENEELVKVLDSYTEWSPSNNGLHTIVSAESIAEKNKIIELFAKGKRRTEDKRDLFIASGYVTVTGNTSVFPTEVRTLKTDELVSILNRYFMSNVLKHPAVIKEDKKRAQAITEARKESLKPVPQKNAPLTQTQVKNFLKMIPVQCLESDIFERLQNDQIAIIDTNCEEEAREPWLIIGQAIHHNFNGSIEGYPIWDNWSREGNKYDAIALKASWDSFKDLPDTQKPITIAAVIKLALAQRPSFPDKTSKGIPKATTDNFYAYLDFFKIKCTLNEITNNYKIVLPDYILKKWNAEQIPSSSALSLAQVSNFIQYDFNKLGFPTRSYNTNSIQTFLTVKGTQNYYNPVRDYFEKCGKNWDKKDYISSLVKTVAVNPRYLSFEASIHAFIRKWLIQVTAAACHKRGETTRLNRVLIFSGPQDIGKTNWVSSIFPKAIRRYCMADKELYLSQFRNEQTKMSMEFSETLIANVNEIDRSFNGKVFSDFKAFLDRTHDKIVLPYGKHATELTRRTVFIGSTNSERFLRDVTGNRRFEVIPTIRLDWEHNIDLDQLWGQVYNLWKGGEKWWFSETIPHEAKIIKDRDIINSQSMYLGDEAFIETLDRVFDPEAKVGWKRMVFATVRTLTGMTDLRTNSRAFNNAKRALLLWSKEVSGKEPTKDAGARPRIWYHMPPLREGEDPEPPEVEDNTAPPDETEEIIAQMKLLKKRLYILNKQKTET